VARLDLQIGKKRTGVSVRPDARWSSMWRIHQGTQVSDMANLSRAKDAAVVWARPRGLGGNEVPHWEKVRETAIQAPPIAPDAEPLSAPVPGAERLHEAPTT
jgi:hypothetical protein